MIQMTPTEAKIFEARLTGVSFSQLSEKDLRISVDQIMLRAAAICGCVLPNTEFFAKFISEEISNFIINFGYGEYTLEEILLAFRINAKLNSDSGHIHFTGNCINVDYVAKILANYTIYRIVLDRKFQNKIDGYEL